ncbi:MAG: DUF4124 domain-containing protein [Lysobacteraceae bacterium]
MRRISPLWMLCLAGLGGPGDAPASSLTVYRCEDAQGRVSLQDHPCAAGQTQRQRQVPRVADSPLPLPQPALPVEPAPAPAAAPIRPPRAPPPPMWLCRDFDGSERESADGQPRGRYVPLWVVGRDPDAPGQFFGRVGAASPVAPIRPVDGPRSAQGVQAEPQVWVEERCRLLGPADTCTRLAAQRSEIERQRFNAQQGDRLRLGEESTRLAGLLSTHCRG